MYIYIYIYVCIYCLLLCFCSLSHACKLSGGKDDGCVIIGDVKTLSQLPPRAVCRVYAGTQLVACVQSSGAISFKVNVWFYRE